MAEGQLLIIQQACASHQVEQEKSMRSLKQTLFQRQLFCIVEYKYSTMLIIGLLNGGCEGQN